MRRAINVFLLISFGFILFAGSVRETYQINPGICDGCAECTFICPNGAISYDMELHCMRIDQNLCDGCGDCVEICPRSAIYPNDARSFIMGTVRDSSTQFGMRGAVVHADTCVAMSGLFGDYCLVLYEGTYDVTCSADGFEDLLVEDVVVQPDTVIKMDFTLVRENDIDDDPIDEHPLAIQCFPNPVRAGNTVRFSLPDDRSCTIEIYNVVGQKLRSLTKASRTSSISWDARDRHGKPLPSGIYLYRVRSGGRKDSGKILLIE